MSRILLFYDQSLNSFDTVNFNALGIGTTTAPIQKLDVEGNIYLNGSIREGKDNLYNAFGVINGFGTATVYYGYSDGYGRGAGVFQSRNNTNNQPFTLFCGYDWDTNYSGATDEPLREIWFGGTYWANYSGGGNPDACGHLFWTDDGYSENGGNTYLNFRILHDKLWIGKAGQYNSPYYGTYARPRYKLDFGDGDMRIRGNYKLGFGGDKDNNYLSTISNDGSYMNFDSSGHPFYFNNDMISTGDVSGATLTAGNGATGSFTTVDLKTVTVTNGIITSIV